MKQLILSVLFGIAGVSYTDISQAVSPVYVSIIFTNGCDKPAFKSFPSKVTNLTTNKVVHNEAGKHSYTVKLIPGVYAVTGAGLNVEFTVKYNTDRDVKINLDNEYCK